jgi:hypothetical protein
MRNSIPIHLAFLALASLAAAEPSCPDGAGASEKQQGNTRILSCLDDQGRPHGPFEVWAYSDTSRTGTGVRIVDGRFTKGKQVGDWTTFDKEGRVVEKSRFVDGKKAEDSHDAE